MMSKGKQKSSGGVLVEQNEVKENAGLLCE